MFPNSLYLHPAGRTTGFNDPVGEDTETKAADNLFMAGRTEGVFSAFAGDIAFIDKTKSAVEPYLPGLP